MQDLGELGVELKGLSAAAEDQVSSLSSPSYAELAILSSCASVKNAIA